MISSSRGKSFVAKLALLLAVVLLASRPAFATVYTYTPATTGTDLWSNGNDWSATPVSGSTTELTFVGSNSTTFSGTNNNIDNNTGVFTLNILDLQGTGPASLSGTINISGTTGSSLSLVSNGGSTPVVNLNALAGSGGGLTYNVANAITLTNNTLFTGDGTATFNFTGIVNGAGSLTKTGSSTLILNNVTEGMTGGVFIQGGTLATQLHTAAMFNGDAITLGGGSSGATLLFYANNTLTTGNAITVAPTTSGTLNITSGAISSLGLVALQPVTLSGSITLNSGVTVQETRQATDALTLSGVITGGSTITIGSANTEVKITGSNQSSFTGNTVINAGILNFNNGSLGTSGGGGTVTFGGASTLQWNAGNTQDMSGFALSAASGVTGTVDINGNAVTFATANGLTGSGNITLASTTAGGTLTLSASNNLTGIFTSVAAASGTTLLTNANALGSATVNPNGSTIFDSSVGGAFNFGNLTGAGALALKDNSGAPVTLTIDGGSSPAAYTGVLSGSGSLVMAGAGVLTLGGADTFSGSLTINSGTVKMGGASALSATNVVFISTSGTFDLNANSDTIAGLNDGSGSGVATDSGATSTLTIGGSNAYSFGGSLAGTLGLKVATTGTGFQVLTGSNTNSGATTVTSAILQVQANAGNTSVGGTSAGLSASSVLTLSSGTLQLRGTSSTTFGTAGVTLTAATTSTVDVNTLSTGSNNTLTLAGAVTAGNNSQLNVTSGNGYALTTGTITGATGATVTIAPSANTSLTVAGINSAGSSQIFAILSGSGSTNLLEYSGGGHGGGLTISNGTVTLSGSDSFNNASGTTAGLILNSGTLLLNNAFALNGIVANTGTTAITIGGGAIDNTSGGLITAPAGASETWSGNFTFLGSNTLNLGTGAITLFNSPTVTVAANTLTVGGIISGTSSLTKVGAGTLALGPAVSTFSGGLNINAGTVQAAGAFTAGAGTVALGTATTSGTLDVNGFTVTVNGLAVASGANAASQIVGNSSTSVAGTLAFQTGTSTFGGTIQNAIGAGTQTTGLTVSSGALTLTGTNTYTGATTLTGGTLQLNGPTTISSTSFTFNGGALALRSNTSGTFGSGSVTVNSGKAATITADDLDNATTGQTISVGNIAATTGAGNTFTLTSGHGYTLSLGTISMTQTAGFNEIFTTTGTAIIAGLVDTAISGGTVTFNGTGTTTVDGFNQDAQTQALSMAISNGTVILGGTGGNNFGKNSAALSITNATLVVGDSNAGVFNGLDGGINVITNGTLDNTTGGLVTVPNLHPTNTVTWTNSVTYLGTNGALTFNPGLTNLVNAPTITVNNNTLTVTGILEGSGLTKAGPGTLVLTGTNIYNAPTVVNSGTLQLGTNGAMAGTAVTVGSTGTNATLFVSGNYTIGQSGTASVTLTATTGSLSTLDGTINTLTISGSNSGSGLVIGGGDAISMEVSGTTSDQIALGSGRTATVSGTNTINLTLLAAIGSGTETLISAPGSGLVTGGTFVLGTISGAPSANSFSLLESGTAISLVDTLNATPTTAYFSGLLSSTWNMISYSGTAALVNFNTDATSGINTNQLPGATTNVHFYTSTPAGTNLSTTLGQNFTINSLTVDGTSTGGESSAISIGGANTLTIAPSSSGTGINIGAGAGLLTISAPLVTGSSQTWTNNSSNALAVSGGLTDAGQTVTIAGSGSGVSITTNTVTLSGSSGFTVNSGAGTLAISAPVSAAATTYWTNNSANAMTVSGTISGAGGLATAGTGIIVLSASNTYTGLTTVSGGTLQLGTNNAIATANNLTVNTGGTFDLNGYTENLGTTATVTDNGTITSSSGTGNLIITSLGLFTGSGLVSGTMNVTYDYTSTVLHTIAVAFANTGNIAVNELSNGGSIQFSGTVNNIGTITNSGTGTDALILGFQSTAGSNIGSNVQSIIESSSTSTLEIGGINNGFASGTGSVIITSGTALIYTTSGTPLGAGNVVSAGTNGVFDANGHATTIAGINNISGAGGMVQASSSATLTLGGSNAYSFGGTLQNVAGGHVLSLTVSLTGTGSQTLTGTNTYTGNTSVTAGLLQIGNGASGSISGSSTTSVSAAGTLALDEATGSTFSNTVTTDSGTIAGAEGAGITNTISSFLSGTGVFIQTGAGTTVLSSATNTFSGGVAVNNGAVSVAVVAVAGSAQGLGDNKTVTLGVNGGTAGTLVYTGTSNTLGQNITALGNGTISNTGGGLLTLSGTLTKNATVLALTSGSFKVTGRIVGTGASFNSDLDVTGSSSVLLSNTNNTYFGPTVVSGSSTLQNGVANALPTSTILTLGSSTDTAGQINAYDLNGFNQSVAGLSSTGSATAIVTTSASSSGTNTLTVTGTNVAETYGGVIQDGNGHVALTVSGGTQVLTGANTYTGATTVTNGTLTVAAVGTAGNANGGTLAGTAVTVNTGGTLLVSASNALGTNSSVILNGGAFKVSGNSSEGTATSVGRGAGPFNNNVQGMGNLTLTAASTLDFGVGSVSTQVFGSFTDATNAILTIADYTSSANVGSGQSGIDGTDDRLIFDVAGGLTTQQLADISFGAGTMAAQINLGGNFYEVSTAVPEPTTIFAGLLLVGFLGLRERRRLGELYRRVATKRA